MVCLRLAHLKDAGKMRPEHVSFAKRNNVNEALKIARDAREHAGRQRNRERVPGDSAHMLNLEDGE